MPTRPIAIVTASAVLAATALGCAAPCPPCAASPAAPAPVAASAAPVPASAAKAPKPLEQRHVHRLDFVLTTTDVGKPPVSSNYTLNVEEDAHGELRLGMNVPLSSGANGSSPRQDVGLVFRCQYTSVGDDLLLHNQVEMSSVEEGGAIRKLSANGDVVLSLGKPALVNSLEDPSSHKRFQVTVTATKLR